MSTTSTDEINRLTAELDTATTDLSVNHDGEMQIVMSQWGAAGFSGLTMHRGVESGYLAKLPRNYGPRIKESCAALYASGVRSQ